MTHMAQETAEAPEAVARFLQRNQEALREIGARLRQRSPPVIITSARGTSDAAAGYFKYLSEIMTGVPCSSMGASVVSVYGAKLLLNHAKGTLSTLKKIFADGGYAGKLITWVQQRFGITLEIVKRNELHKFVVLPIRWIIERTNAWVSKARRLAKDYERKTLNQESMIYIRMIQLMLKWV